MSGSHGSKQDRQGRRKNNEGRRNAGSDAESRRSFPRRMEMAPDGMIWVGEFNGGKMARFDPKTETFKEYPLPGPDPTPYSMGFDADGYLWYDSHRMDYLGRFDTKTEM